jgi:ribosome recycling factor
MSTDASIQNAVTEFDKTLKHLGEEFGRLQIGRANPSLVEHCMVEAYGMQQPLRNLANISVPDAKTLQIQPWDKSVMAAVEKAIQMANLNLNPVNRGDAILINIPPLTEERRKELVTIVHRLAEEARISVRNIRQTVHAKFKTMSQEKQITEDEAKGAEKKLQDKVDQANQKVEELTKHKEEAIMTV